MLVGRAICCSFFTFLHIKWAETLIGFVSDNFSEMLIGWAALKTHTVFCLGLEGRFDNWPVIKKYSIEAAHQAKDIINNSELARCYIDTVILYDVLGNIKTLRNLDASVKESKRIYLL